MKYVRPIMICKDGPTTGISSYLGDLLHRLFMQVTHCRLFSNGLDVIEVFENYVDNVGLQSTTRFVTFDIDEICAHFSHELTLKALEYFLVKFSQIHALDGLLIKTIIDLVRLVLMNQYFVYRNKLYQQIYGSPLGNPLTIPLACMYFFYTQATWLTVMMSQEKNELFGR